MHRFLVYAFGTFGGTGYAPIAPATAASFAVAVIWWLSAPVPIVIQAVLLLAVAALGVPVAGWLAARHGADPRLVVCDEVSGMLITYCGITTGPAGWVAGFLWFRFFDIWKPFPVRACERLRGGWGIMADDWVAGIYAHLALRLTLWLLGWSDHA